MLPLKNVNGIYEDQLPSVDHTLLQQFLFCQQLSLTL